jgi:L-fucose isomerase-like protein
MNINPKIGLCVIYHPFEDNAENAAPMFEESYRLLTSFKDITIIKANELVKDINSVTSVAKQFKNTEVDVICVKLATWSSDEYILDMSSICDVPFIFWTYSHISAGSLCGGQQFNMVFKELNKECIFVYKDNDKALDKIKKYSKSVAIRNQLKRIRLCRIGNRTQGMAEVICDEFSVKEIFGPRILSIRLDEFKKAVENISNESARSKWLEIKSKGIKIEVSEENGIHAVKNYLALKEYVKNQKIDGFTIQCYPNYMGEVCLGFSLLADGGIACACESDVSSLILTFILIGLSDQPVHNIDPLFLYDEDNSILGSHCGCGSFELAESKEKIQFSNVRLANKGLCVLFPSKPGNVTLANLVGRKGTYRMGVIEAVAVKTKMVFPGNPIRIKLPISIERYLERIEESGLGHHWIIAYGSYSESLKYLASLINIDFIEF